MKSKLWIGVYINLAVLIFGNLYAYLSGEIMIGFILTLSTSVLFLAMMKFGEKYNLLD